MNLTKHALAYIAISILVGVPVLFLYQQQSYASGLTQQQLRHYARLATIEYDIFIEQTRTFLSVVSTLPQVKGSDDATCNALLSEILGADTRYANAGAIRPDGQLWCSAVPFTAPVDLSDRTYFQRARDTNDFSVGDFQVGRVTGRPTINFGYPVHDASGKTVSIAFVAVNLSWLEQFAQTANLPPGATLILLDNSGHELARYPGSPNVGQEAPEVSLPFDNVVHLEQGLGETQTHDSNGKSYYLIAVPLRREPQEGYLHLIITIPKENLTAAVLASL
jgi:hypothetical protein